MKRRIFLKTLGASSAGVVAFSCADRERADKLASEDAGGLEGVKWDKAPCRFCGTGCHVMVGVKNDKVVAVTGASNVTEPLSSTGTLPTTRFSTSNRTVLETGTRWVGWGMISLTRSRRIVPRGMSCVLW